MRVRTVRGARALRERADAYAVPTRAGSPLSAQKQVICVRSRVGSRARPARVDCGSHDRTWVTWSACASSVPWLCGCACSGEWFSVWVQGWRTRLSESCECAASHALLHSRHTTGRDLLKVVWRVSDQHAEPRVAMQVVVAACPA